MKKVLVIIIFVLLFSCGSRYVNVETQRFNVKVKQLYRKNGVLIVYYLKSEFKGHKLTSTEHDIKISEESSLHSPILMITETASVNELRGTKNVLEMKYNLVLPTGYKIKVKE